MSTNDKWKVGNEYLPYHPSASHVRPDYRDGWNACYEAAKAPHPQDERGQGLCNQGRHPAPEIAGYAALIHYPEHWDIAAYPTLESAVREALAWASCSACKDPEAYGLPDGGVSEGQIEEWKTKAADYDRLAGIARNRRRVLEEIAGSKALTATPQQFADHLQRLAKNACEDYTFAGNDDPDGGAEAQQAAPQAEVPARTKLISIAADVRAGVAKDRNLLAQRIEEAARMLATPAQAASQAPKVAKCGYPECKCDGPAEDGGCASTYTYAIGDAGQAYMARFPNAHSLPATFRWQELWDAMSAAATPAQAEAKPAGQGEADMLRGVEALAREAYEHWDADREYKVGKILLALIGHNKGYDKRADAFREAIATSRPAQVQPAEQVGEDGDRFLVSRELLECALTYPDTGDSTYRAIKRVLSGAPYAPAPQPVSADTAIKCLREAFRDMEAIKKPVEDSASVLGYFINRLNAALSPQQAEQGREKP